LPQDGIPAVTRAAVVQRQESGDQGTFGTITCVNGPRFFSGELPWRDNRRNESCVKPGTYVCRYILSPHLKKFTYHLFGVPGRDGVLLHSANLMGDRAKGFKAQLLGCVAAGERIGYMDRQKAILMSAPAVRAIETFFERQPFELEIRDGNNR
jgi:hypothetical protein